VFPLGTTTVTWTVTDNAGLTSTDTQVVTVTDNESPTITAPADVAVNTDASSCDATGVALGSATTSDNCGVASLTNNAPAVFPLGTTTVTWTVTDNAGLTATDTQVVTVTDNEAPTITAPADIAVNADASSCDATGVALGSATTADNCGVASVTNDAPAVFPLGTTTVTWTVTDNAGLTATDTQVVTVTDNEDPVITGCPADISVMADDEYCGNSVTWTLPTASDNCSVVLSSTHNPGDFFAVGTTTVIYTAEDGSGNTVTCSFNVTVDPATPPVITGDMDVCTPVTLTYSTPLLAGKTYQWSVSEGLILGSSTDADVDIEWMGTAAGTLSVEITSGSGCSITNSVGVIKHATPVIGTIQSSGSLTRR